MDRSLRGIGTGRGRRTKRVTLRRRSGTVAHAAPSRAIIFPAMAHTERIVQVGLVQQRASANAPPASRAPSRACAPPPPGARRSSACRSSSRDPYFCRRKITGSSSSPEHPRPVHEALGRVRGGAGRRDRGQPLREARRGTLSQHAAIIDADGPTRQVPKMHIPDDPQYLEKFYFTRATWLPPWDTKFGRIGVLVCWTSGIPRGAAHRAPRGADPVLSHGDRLASAGEGGVRRHRPMRGRRSSGATPSRTACSCARSIASASRMVRQAASSSGPELRGRSRRAGHRRAGEDEEVIVVPATLGRWTCSAPTGRVLSDGASRPTGTSRSASSTTDGAHPAQLRLTACRPSGRRIAVPGSAGRTRKPPGPASSSRCPDLRAHVQLLSDAEECTST